MDDEVVGGGAAQIEFKNLLHATDGSVYESYWATVLLRIGFVKVGVLGCRLTRILTLTFDSILPTIQIFNLWVPWGTLVKRKHPFGYLMRWPQIRFPNKLVLKYSKNGHKWNTLFHCQQTDKVTGTIGFDPFFSNITRSLHHFVYY